MSQNTRQNMTEALEISKEIQHQLDRVIHLLKTDIEIVHLSKTVVESDPRLSHDEDILEPYQMEELHRAQQEEFFQMQEQVANLMQKI